MAGLITNSQKASLEAAFKAAMETFFVPIYVYSAPERVVVTEDPNYNYFNGSDQNNTTPDNEPILSIISGRIQYGQKQNYPSVSPSFPNVNVPDGEVRIKVDASYAALFSSAKVIELNGSRFTVDTTPRYHGLFSGTFATFYLKRIL